MVGRGHARSTQRAEGGFGRETRQTRQLAAAAAVSAAAAAAAAATASASASAPQDSPGSKPEHEDGFDQGRLSTEPLASESEPRSGSEIVSVADSELDRARELMALAASRPVQALIEDSTASGLRSSAEPEEGQDNNRANDRAFDSQCT